MVNVSKLLREKGEGRAAAKLTVKESSRCRNQEVDTLPQLLCFRSFASAPNNNTVCIIRQLLPCTCAGG